MKTSIEDVQENPQLQNMAYQRSPTRGRANKPKQAIHKNVSGNIQEVPQLRSTALKSLLTKHGPFTDLRINKISVSL